MTLLELDSLIPIIMVAVALIAAAVTLKLNQAAMLLRISKLEGWQSAHQDKTGDMAVQLARIQTTLEGIKERLDRMG